MPEVEATGAAAERGVAAGGAVPGRAPGAEAHARGHGWAPAGGALAGGLGAAAVALAWGAGAALDAPWLALWPSRLLLRFDALGGPIALFSVALLVPILVYAGGYLPARLAEHALPARAKVRFTALMVAFGAAMVLLTTAQDLLVLFVALELTALASFLLIGFEHEDESHRSAMVALLVTVGSSLLFVVGALLVGAELGTLEVGRLRGAVARGEAPSTVAAALLAAGVVGKSAQVPLHFWLPRAMVAPTPVSAYLHSATLVAAGVFVLARLRFLVGTSPAVLDALLVVGFASVAVGGAMALTRQGMKAVLAYSTIAQYGYGVVLLALGGKDGAFGAPFFLVAHGLPKAALFMVAGCVTHATGAHDLDEARGALRAHPALALAAGVAAAALAGAPLTVGYFKDELLFAAARHAGPAVAALATLAALLTVGYAGRFLLILVARPGERPRPRHALPWTMTAPIFALVGLSVVGGLWLAPLSHVFSEAGRVVADGAAEHHLGYHLRPEVAMAAAAWGLGALLLATRTRWQAGADRAVDAVADRVGPAVVADRARRGVAWISDTLHRVERRDLRDRLTSVLVPTAVLVGLGLAAAGERRFAPGPLRLDDLPLLVGLAVAAAAGVAAARQVQHLALVLVMSFVGFVLALVFTLEGAPDVALILVLVETLTTILFVAVLARMREDVLRRACTRAAEGGARWVGWVAGLAAFVVAWTALDAARPDRVAWAHARLTPEAHGSDVVTVILADFRGLDTAGEITAFAVAVLGAGAIGWARR